MRRSLIQSDSDGTAGARDSRGPRSRRRIAAAWLLVAIWAGVIWMLGGDEFSLQDTSQTMSSWFGWLIGDLDHHTRYRIYLVARKSAHFFEYAILALLTFRAALLTAERHRLATAGWVALFLVATLATADEARQAFSAARTGSPIDVFIDITGGVIAVLGIIVISRRMRARAPAQPAA